MPIGVLSSYYNSYKCLWGMSVALLFFSIGANKPIAIGRREGVENPLCRDGPYGRTVGTGCR